MVFRLFVLLFRLVDLLLSVLEAASRLVRTNALADLVDSVSVSIDADALFFKLCETLPCVNNFS